MKYEPVVDKTALIQATREAYGFPITNLTFLPEGWVGCHYIAACASPEKYFITLLTDSRLSRLQAERLEFSLSLTRHLYDRDLYRALVPPRRTLNGQLRTDFQGQPLTAADFIPGGNLAGSRPYSREDLVSIGNLIARLHRVTPDLGLDIPYREDFSIPFKTDFYRSLADLDQIDAKNRVSQQTVRDLFLPRREMLLKLMDRLKELGEAARALQPTLVLVHTDPTPANLLRRSTGELVLVDWEGVRLAPAEQDLALLSGEGFLTLLAEYMNEANHPRLYPQLFAYYFHRRFLEDITDFLIQILHENTTEEQDQQYMQEDLPDWLDSIPFLEKSEELAAGWLAAVAEPDTQI